MPDLSVVVVNYYSGDDLRRCLASLVAGRGALDLEIVVVDNGSADGSLHGIDAVAPDTTVVVPGGDIGFGAGVNRGLAVASAPWVLVVNPDAVLTSGTLEAFVGAAERNPTVALAGPRIESPAGDLTPSQAHFPSLWRELAEALRVHRLPGLRRAGRVIESAARHDTEGRPDWVAGAVMLMRRNAIDAVGGFDEDFFLYWEEVDWCRRARRNGWEIAYLPAAVFAHEGGGVRQVPELFATLVASNAHYYRKHYGPARAALHRAVLLLNLGLRAVAARAKVAAGRDASGESAVFATGIRELRRGGHALRRPAVGAGR